MSFCLYNVLGVCKICFFSYQSSCLFVVITVFGCCKVCFFFAKKFFFCYCRYVRVLGAFYLRLTGSDVDVYRYLEPLYNDYRKVRQKLSDGSKFLFFFFCSVDLKCLIGFVLFTDEFCFLISLGFELRHVDEVVEELLTKDYSCDIAMPRLKKRFVLLYLKV